MINELTLIIIFVFIIILIIGISLYYFKKFQHKIEKQNISINSQSNLLITMASMINHDLRNSVENVEFAALELTRMVKTKEFNILDDVEEILRTSAQQQTERIKSVNELLKIAKYQSDTEVTSENIQELILEILHKQPLSATFHVKNSLNFTYKVNKNLFEVVMNNLIKNGTEHNNQKIKKINIYKENNSIVFEDNGVGFPVERLNELKQFKVKSDNLLGKGQGLFIITNTLDIMGWELQIKNIGTGSKFILKYK